MDQDKLKDSAAVPDPVSPQATGGDTLNVSALTIPGQISLDDTDETRAVSPLPDEGADELPEMEDEELRYFEEDEESAQADLDFTAEQEEDPKANKPLWPIPDFIGLSKVLFADQKSGGLRALAVVLCVLIFIPAVFAAAFIYLALAATVIFIMALLILLAIAVIAGGLAGFGYALVMLFTSDLVVALIEIGLGTMLIGIVLALSGLFYELIAVQLPRLIRLITRIFVYAVKWIKAFLFGARTQESAQLQNTEAGHE